MNDSFDQHAGQSPWAVTGSRQTAHRRGNTRSSAAPHTARAAAAPCLSRAVQPARANWAVMVPMAVRYRRAGDLSCAFTA